MKVSEITIVNGTLIIVQKILKKKPRFQKDQRKNQIFQIAKISKITLKNVGDIGELAVSQVLAKTIS